jgi:uncharacterized protein YodC (DUF2158 family)
MKFKSGNVVKLRSGGPKMVVVDYDRSNVSPNDASHTVKCDWFNESKKCTDLFHEDTIELIGKEGSNATEA